MLLAKLLAVVAGAVGVIGNCNQFQENVNNWHVSIDGDMTLYESDFEGRTYVRGTATIRNFAFGEKRYYQCTNDAVMTANRVIADSGNFCGGKIGLGFILLLFNFSDEWRGFV
jgi:hypothetical protein